MSAEEEKQRDKKDSHAAVPSLPIREDRPEEEPSDSSTEGANDEKDGFLKSFDNLWRSYKFRQLRNNPKAWIEIPALITVVCYTIYAGMQAHIMNQTLDEIRKQTPKIAQSAEATKSAADTASHQLELAERPWVDAQISINGPFTFNINGASIPLKFVLRNTGHSPAFGTIINPQAVPTFFKGGLDPVVGRDQLCRDAHKITTNFGLTIFPNNPLSQDYEIGIAKEEVERSNREQKGSILMPTVIVCIVYRPTFNHTSVYETAYILDLMRIDSANQINARFKIGEVVPAGRLVLRLHPWNSVYAE